MKRILLYTIVASLVVITISGGVLIWLHDSEEIPQPMVAEPVTMRLIETGQVMGGYGKHGARAWLGIPYAAPPLGRLRWMPPEPPVPFSTILRTTSAGNICPQYIQDDLASTGHAAFRLAGKEDCLYLNVWSAPNAADAPVMLWLHGGGNTVGQGDIHDGSLLAARQGVVVVTINYRLGVLGWFAEPSLRTGDPVSDSGNFGLLDILRALQWVQDNISKFGGNPENVTLFGASAGGADTLAVLASRRAKHLVHRAIVQSGSYRPTILEAQATSLSGEGWAHTYTAKLEASGVLGTGLTGSDRARSLRETSVEDLFVALEPAAFGMIFMPTLLSDGYVLPPSDASAVFSNPSGYQQVPIILGSNRDEAALFLMNHDDYRSSLFGLFPRVKNEADYRRVVRYISDATKIRTVDEIADWMLESSHADVFAYRFDWDEQRTILGYDVSVALGAAHGIEVPFVFGSFDMFPPLTRTFPMDEPQSRLSADIMSYWAEFARSGDPGTGGRGENPVWNRWAHSGTRLLILDTESGGGIRMEDVHVDQASLRKALASDSDFKRKQEHCKTYVLAFRGTPEFDSGEYERIGCAEFPVEPVSMF